MLVPRNTVATSAGDSALEYHAICDDGRKDTRLYVLLDMKEILRFQHSKPTWSNSGKVCNSGFALCPAQQAGILSVVMKLCYEIMFLGNL